MTLGERTAEPIEAWTGTDSGIAARLNRIRPWERTELLCRHIKAEACEGGRHVVAVLLDNQTLYPLPGGPGEGPHA